ncbi:MAG: radical SAM protein [Chloroflexaceae bacterium]|nr:radical SAM protein [Chloroflexaceae bacterium]
MPPTCLYASGELSQRVEQSRAQLAACTLCPQGCRTNRLADKTGKCGAGRYALVASACAHMGEERVLRGHGGSGTVFFSGCNLHCVFCQNYDISQYRYGGAMEAEELAALFISLQQRGCHNLNLVTPSHVVPQLLTALLIAVERDFRLPIVYNTAAYDALPTLRLLDGIVDIYMPDLKYSDSDTAARYSGIGHYWEVSTKALKEMHRQVGPLAIENGLARRGVLIRHLVLPGDLAGTAEVMRFIAHEVSADSWVNLMPQYYPAFRANTFPELRRRTPPQEYSDAVQAARQVGLHRGIPFDALD